MPYVRRDPCGAIASLHRDAPTPSAEFLPDNAPEVRAFLAIDDDTEAFAKLDAGFVRVLEDVIDTLIDKHIINITDLPSEAQAKLFSRKSFRERQGRHALSLFGDLNPTFPHDPSE
ncbi:MAG: hypothetical protein C4K60_11170 [Ideonella sp. MAG2]|nr:MAG: hypothetical protein C4K60_11170 [Ideonella sp. MAG2]